MNCLECFRKFKGAFYLAMVIVIWVGSAVLIQAIFTSKETEFNKPLFLTYVSCSSFSVYLIPLLYDWYKIRNEVNKHN